MCSYNLHHSITPYFHGETPAVREKTFSAFVPQPEENKASVKRACELQLSLTFEGTAILETSVQSHTAILETSVFLYIIVSVISSLIDACKFFL
jgi:hypothetical protein